MKRQQLIALTTLTVVPLLYNSCRVDAFSSPAQLPLGGGISKSRRESSSRWYRDTDDDGEVNAENQNEMQQDPRRRFRSRRTRQQNRQKQPRRREQYPVSSYSHKLFATNQVLPPLDVSELPPPQDKPTSRNSADDSVGATTKTSLSKPYSNSNRFASEMLTPSLRQRDDPDDETCVPTVCGPLPVTYTNSPRVVERWLADNVPRSGNGASSVGFDVESVPNAPWIKHLALFDGPAVVQVSTPDSALVIHLTRERNQRQSTACTAVSALLSDPTIVKVCTSIDDDMLELYRFNRQLKARSRFDLGGIGSGRGSKQRIGLQRLVRAVLGVEMKKSKKLAMSNWSKPLTKQQVEYAARDAWAGAAVIHDLAERHPETFSADSIVRLLRDERPIQEVHNRATRRKEARTQLKTIREQYQQYSAFDLQYKPQKLGLPPIVSEELDRVREVLEETSPDGLIGFDAEPLGLNFDQQRS
mmetsp:Transcript_22619/g.65105  ORF Transcript_22619/g.65105 Transcript_22619/m.65105 type:complete len:472 (+) Transcript_22619:54-1469(+)